MGRKKVEMMGKRYGKLVVIEEAERNKRRNIVWLCRCDCGKKIKVVGTWLRTGNTRSCGCLKGNILPKGNSAINTLFKSYKYSAKKRNLDFFLTKKEFKSFLNSNCYYCGVEPFSYFKGKSMNGGIKYNGIDRVNNSKGYSMNNCVPCCKICNRAKKNISVEEFYNWMDRIKEMIRNG